MSDDPKSKVRDLIEEDSDDVVEKLCKLPQSVRDSVDAAGEVLESCIKSGDVDDEEEVASLIKAFTPLRNSVVPQVYKTETKQLTQWFRDHHVMMASPSSDEKAQKKDEEASHKRLSEMFGKIHKSVLLGAGLGCVREQDRHLAVAFLITVGQAVHLSSYRDAPKYLKMASILQTWCQRLTIKFFQAEESVREDIEGAGIEGGVCATFVRARKARTDKLYKQALNLFNERADDTIKGEVRDALVACFDGRNCKSRPLSSSSSTITDPSTHPNTSTTISFSTKRHSTIHIHTKPQSPPTRRSSSRRRPGRTAPSRSK